LDFARVLRILKLYAGHTCDWHNTLAIVDPRTLLKLLDRGGLTKSGRVPNISTFLRSQRFIGAPVLLSAVQAMLDLPEH
jgi:hypothetical protein